MYQTEDMHHMYEEGNDVPQLVKRLRGKLNYQPPKETWYTDDDALEDEIIFPEDSTTKSKTLVPPVWDQEGSSSGRLIEDLGISHDETSSNQPSRNDKTTKQLKSREKKALQLAEEVRSTYISSFRR